MKVNKGYTLIEVLVSMVIFSVLITLAVSSYRYFFSATSKKNSQSYNLSMLTERKIINTSIQDIQAYYYQDFDGKNKLFFHGTKNSFSFVSNSPSYLDASMVVATVFASHSNTQLRYCEQALGSVSLLNFHFRESDCSNSKLYLLSENIKFLYFSWKDAFELDNYYSDLLNITIKPKPMWRTQYLSAQTLALPLMIKIKIETKPNQDLLPAELMFKVPQEQPQAKRDKNASSG